jgi:hypothetical protein
VNSGVRNTVAKGRGSTSMLSSGEAAGAGGREVRGGGARLEDACCEGGRANLSSKSKSSGPITGSLTRG